MQIGRRQKLFRPFYGGIGSIFVLHRVVEELSEINRVVESTPKRLKQYINYLHKNNYEFLSLDEALDGIVNHKRFRRNYKRFAVFTFDDGYQDNYDLAYPLLKKEGIPFTIYLNPGFIEQKTSVWWIILEEIIQKQSNIQLPESFGNEVLTWHDKESRLLAYQQIAQIVTQAGTNTESIMKFFCNQVGINSNKINENLIMSENTLKKLGKDNLFSPGAHTLNHYCLSQLNEAKLEQEIVESKYKLEKIFGKKINHFAYPFGNRDHCGKREFQAVKHAGFNSAVTTRSANIFPGHIKDTFALPRIPLYEEMSVELLELYITGFIPAKMYNYRRKITL